MKETKSIMMLLLLIPCLFLFTGCGGDKNNGGGSNLLAYTVSGTVLTGVTDYGKTLTEINIAEGITEISEKAFKDCKKLKNVTIPNSVTTICENVFTGCNKLEKITTPFVGKTENTNLAYLFGGNSFEDNKNKVPFSLKEVVLTNCSNLGFGTFSYCMSLTNVTIPSTVTEIGDGSFYGCSSLTNITIPNGVISIETTAFGLCQNLTSITIPSSVTSIGKRAFYSCYKLVEVKNLSSLNIVAGSDDFGGVGYYAKRIYTEGESYVLTDANGFITYNDGTEVYLVAYLGKEENITIPNNVTIINTWAFRNTYVSNVLIPKSVKIISDSGFEYSTLLKNVTFEDNSNLESIEYGAFQYCNILKSVDFGANSKLENIGDFAFNQCFDLTSIEIPSSVTSIGISVFEECDKLTYNIYDNAKYLGNSENPYLILIESINDEITSCMIHSDTKIIYNFAFSSCSNLVNITIPSNVTNIGSSIFNNCGRLTSVFFENPIGWKVVYRWGEETIEISSEALSDTSTAATYLKSTYNNYYWARG